MYIVHRRPIIKRPPTAKTATAMSVKHWRIQGKLMMQWSRWGRKKWPRKYYQRNTAWMPGWAYTRRHVVQKCSRNPTKMRPDDLSRRPAWAEHTINITLDNTHRTQTSARQLSWIGTCCHRNAKQPTACLVLSANCSIYIVTVNNMLPRMCTICCENTNTWYRKFSLRVMTYDC